MEATTVQLVWRSLGIGPTRIDLDNRTFTICTGIDAGALFVDGLEAGSSHTATICGPDRTETVDFTTLTPPPGPQLAKFATISDLHLGAKRFGIVGRIKEGEVDGDTHALRCAKAAVREATEWGAELLLIKGDLTHHTTPAHWDEFAALLDSITIPYAFVIGNHDVKHRTGSIPASRGLEMVGEQRRRFQVHDLDRLRIILADGAVAQHSRGEMGSLPEKIHAAAAVKRPVLVALHFHLHRTRVPWFFPPGFSKADADKMLLGLAEANPQAFVTSGHSHRNRAYRYGRVPITEVGSTKDYPGVWAGYTVHDGGIAQVVRRIGEPSCLEWTERTRRAVGGIWSMWSPGTLDQRCFSHVWPDPHER